MDLPKLYMDQLNQCAQDIPKYDRERKLNWFKFKYTSNQELRVEILGLEENNEKK